MYMILHGFPEWNTTLNDSPVHNTHIDTDCIDVVACSIHGTVQIRPIFVSYINYYSTSLLKPVG